MKRLALSALCLVLLAGCETAGGPPVGPSDLALEPGRERVMFRGVSGASAAEVGDRALLHAANLALMQGYDWFRVVGRSVEIAPPTSPRFTVGVGGMSFGRHSALGVGGAESFGGEGTYLATLEVVFGRGARPPGADVYDAHGVAATLGPRLAPPPAR